MVLPLSSSMYDSEAVDIAGGGRGSGGKNVIFSNCPYDQSKYSDPLLYLNMMSIKFCQKNLTIT